MITCKKCGIAKPEEEFLIFHKTAGFPTAKKICRSCRNDKNRNYHKTNKEKIYNQNLKSRKKHIEKYRESTNKRIKSKVDTLSDDYVITLIKSNTRLTTKDIRENPEIIEVKRLIIKTQRLCKTLQN